MKILLKFLPLFISANLFCQILSFTDPNFKLALLDASEHIHIAQNFNNEWVSIDINQNGEIETYEASLIKALDFNYGETTHPFTSIEGINGFANLEKFEIWDYNVASINLEGLSELKHLKLKYTGVSDLSIDNLSFLEDVEITQHNLNSFTFSNLPSLKNLFIPIKELHLANLPVLDSLNNDNYTLQHTISFTNVPNLRYLNISGGTIHPNMLENVKTSLEILNASEAFISDITEIDLSEFISLKELSLVNNGLESIQFPPNNSIEYLDISLNKLQEFDKSLFSSLKHLDLHWNNVFVLDLSNMTTLEFLNYNNNWNHLLTDLTYNQLNLENCINLQRLYVDSNNLQILDLTNLSNLTEVTCTNNVNIFSQNGLETIILTNCQNLENFIADNNRYLTEIDFSCSQNLENVNLNGCDSLKTINLKNGHNDDELILSTYFSDNLLAIGIDVGEILPLYNSDTPLTEMLTFTPICTYNTIIGKVYFDFDGDGCQEDEGIQNIKINYETEFENSFTFSQFSGEYIIYSKDNIISLSPENDLYELWDFGLEEPVTFQFTDSDILYYDFCLAPNTEHNDLEIHLVPMEDARPGFDTDYKIIYSNNGNTILSGEITLEFQNELMAFISSDPPNDFIQENTIKWNYDLLNPFESREILFSFELNAPTDEPPLNSADILNFTAKILPVEDDETPENNESSLFQTVVNSYDPNDKTCLSGETLSVSEIGKYVDYLIRFENTGTADAVNVVIVDFIDLAKFDITSLTLINSSHDVYSRMSDGNKVEFIFENIQLPFNDENNDGYVLFKIKTKADLEIGDMFSNQAFIYFDYNLPIITNNFTTTIVGNMSVFELNPNKNTIIYPNPTKDLVNILSETPIQKIEITDLSGKFIKLNSNNALISIKELATGIYIINIYLENGEIISEKIIKQ